MRIRDVEPGDWDGIWPFLREIVAAGETFAYPRDLPEDQARASWLLEPPSRTVVAVDPDGTIVGTAKLQPNHGGPGAHISSASFMVHPDHAGRGIGRALCEHVLDRARQDGYTAMVFNAVAASNTRAVALYRSVGFEVLGTVPGGFRHPALGPVGLHIMHRPL